MRKNDREVHIAMIASLMGGLSITVHGPARYIDGSVYFRAKNGCCQR
jgi:hypothetical protein